jgi:hypothetical protein
MRTPTKYKVRLKIYRGADTRPIGQRQIEVITVGALDAAFQAEQLVNVTVRDNEYAAATRVVPLPRPKPAIITTPALAVAA